MRASAWVFLALGCGLVEIGTGPEVGDSGADTSISDAGGEEASLLDVVDADVVEPETGPMAPGDFSELELWLRGDEGVVLSDGGVDASLGPSTVATWQNQSPAGASRDVAIATGVLYSGGPQLAKADVSFNGHDVVSFDGDDALFSLPWVLASPMTVFLVGKSQSASGTFAYWFDSVTGKQLAVLAQGPSSALSLAVGTGPLVPLVGIGSVSLPSVVIAAFDSGNVRLYLSSNAVAFSGTTTNVASLNGVTVGNFQGRYFGYSMNGKLAEVALFRTPLNTPSVKSLNMYAAARYGITIP